MTRKLFFIIITLLSLTVSAQKKKKTKDIMLSTDIAEIENFLKTAHPEDPRRTSLKPKLIALKNAAWTAGAKNAKPMEARPITIDIPNSVMKNPNSDEAEEFKKLIAESSQEHTKKTVSLLNTLFDQDINKKEAILLVQNNSDCNIIIRVNGKSFFNLAIPAHGENSLVLNKGQYELTSNVCGSRYQSNKDIQKSMLVILNNPTYQAPTKK